MRRSQRQKLNAPERDWVSKRAIRYNKLPGAGKYRKKSMSRRLRRLPIERDDE
jgi:hypothetical protein